MKRRAFLGSALAVPISRISADDGGPVLRVVLNAESPAESHSYFLEFPEKKRPVGLGRNGVLQPGETFKGGYSLLGDFRVNAILSAEVFEMSDRLVAMSGYSREWLAEHLLANMTSIDFDGDGKGGEYGDAFISLEPIENPEAQPFHFGEYKGVFRWYSYAIHGTQDESRIGKCVTGGCINVAKTPLSEMVQALNLGDLVRVVSTGG
jgi:hypothetical protein